MGRSGPGSVPYESNKMEVEANAGLQFAGAALGSVAKHWAVFFLCMLCAHDMWRLGPPTKKRIPYLKVP